MKEIIASGPIIIECGKLLVSKDSKDDFYKIPGGTVKPGEELEATCIREVKEETNADIEIIKPLSTMVLNKNPQTKEEIKIMLHHYKAKLKNKSELKPNEEGILEVKWLDIEEIKSGKWDVAPNIKFLIEKGDLE
jgi:8-oxo-dGTP diphosphatase